MKMSGTDLNNNILFRLAEQSCSDRKWLAGLECLSLLQSSQYSAQLSHSLAKEETIHLILLILNHIEEDEQFQLLLTRKQQTKLQQVQSIYSDNAEVMIAISCTYFGLELHEKALEAAETAIALEPHNAVALETFENVCCHVVDRWHFIMLNDVTRNTAYKKALQEVITQQHKKHVSVLDIGCGTGILSFLATEWSDEVYAVERSSVMCNIARNTLEACHTDKEILKRIKVLNKMSTDINIPADLPARVDVLVTEIFDAGLFGEGILSSLGHAWKELLKSGCDKKSVVIPYRASLYVEAIESQDLRKERIVNGWKYGVKTDNLQIMTNVGMLESDPYTSIHLNNLPTRFKSLSSSQQFLLVDFNDPKSILEMNKGFDGRLTLDIMEEGILDALVVWFKLHVTSTIEVWTHMESGGCWEQAVFPVSDVRLLEIPSSIGIGHLTVCPGDKISAAYSIQDDRLSMAVTSVSRPLTQPLAINKPLGFPLPNQLLSHPLAWCPYNIYCLLDWEIKMLNSTLYQETLLAALNGHFCIDPVTVTSQPVTSHSQFVHINNGFSPLCLQAISQGFSQVQVIASEDSHKALLWKLVQINNIDISKVKTMDDVSELESEEKAVDPGNHMDTSSPQTPTIGRDMAVVVFDVVDQIGQLVENWTDKLESIKEYLGGFTSSHILPEVVDIWGMFIESDSLLRRNRVISDENVLGYPVKNLVNKYSTLNHPDMSLAVLQHTKLTSAFKMFSLNFTKEISNTHLKGESDFSSDNKSCTEDGNQNVMKKGEGNTTDECSITNQVVNLKVPTIAEGKVDALVYWFNLHLSPSHCVSTLDPDHYWQQAAIILDHGWMEQGKDLNLKFSLQNSTIFVTFLE